MTLFSVSVTSEVIGLILGAYGTIASSLIYYYSWRPRIRVHVFNASILSKAPGRHDVLMITAANHSWQRTTTLGTSRLAFSRDVSLGQPMEFYRDPQDLPYEIRSGSKELTIGYDKGQLVQWFKEAESGKWGKRVPFHAVISGQGRQEFRSKKKWLNTETGFVLDRSFRARLTRMYNKVREILNIRKS
jgi:hypothetical protein